MSFDLNIHNYTRDELIEMFDLPPHFDKNILEIKETKLRENIFKNNTIDIDTQKKTLQFIVEAKNIILNGPQTTTSELSENLDDIYNTRYELNATTIEDPGEHMVQLKEKKPYISSYPSEYFPGIINPLKKKIKVQNLNVDTRFRDNYYLSPSTNFNFNLPIQLNEVIKMQLSAIELPTTYYVISKQYKNNFFYITVNGEKGLIEINSGNYELNTVLDAINAQLTLLGGVFTYVTFDSNLAGLTGSAQIMVGPSGTGVVSDISLDFQSNIDGNEDTNTPLPLKFGWLLGFRNGKYEGNLNYVSEGVSDFTGPKYLFLVIDDYNNNVNNNFFSAFNASVLNKNILARISIDSSNFNILLQNNLSLITTPREYFGPVKIQNMNIQLLDEYGRIVDLNNMDFSFCLTLTSIYDI